MVHRFNKRRFSYTNLFEGELQNSNYLNVTQHFQGSSVVNSFYGGVNRAGLQLAGAALLGTGGKLWNIFHVLKTLI